MKEYINVNFSSNRSKRVKIHVLCISEVWNTQTGKEKSGKAAVFSICTQSSIVILLDTSNSHSTAREIGESRRRLSILSIVRYAVSYIRGSSFNRNLTALVSSSGASHAQRVFPYLKKVQTRFHYLFPLKIDHY